MQVIRYIHTKKLKGYLRRKIQLEMIDFSGINIELRDTFREWDAMMRENLM